MDVVEKFRIWGYVGWIKADPRLELLCLFHKVTVLMKTCGIRNGLISK